MSTRTIEEAGIAADARRTAPDLHVRTVGLGKTFGSSSTGAAVTGLNLDVERGEMYGLLGPSGCGKTTTLNMLAGFLDPSEGEVLIDGNVVNDVPSYKRGIALVFQNYALFPHLTAADNVAFGMKVQRVPKAKRAARVAELLDLVGLSASAGKHPGEMSGGQQQRVAIARALAVDPSVILLDEPLSNLDARLRAEMRVELKRILREAGVTVLLVTHDQSEAFSVCDRVALMFGGRLETVASPRDLYVSPVSRAAAEFIGEGTFFQGALASSTGGDLKVSIDCTPVEVPARSASTADAGQTGAVFVRPEFLTVTEPDDPRALLTGVVEDVSYLGETVAYLIQTAGIRVMHKALSTRHELRLGDRVGMTWSAQDALFFPDDRPAAGQLR